MCSGLLWIVKKYILSDHQLLLQVPRSKLKNKGDKAFNVVEKLPLKIKSAELLPHFKKLLRIHLYRQAMLF